MNNIILGCVAFVLCNSISAQNGFHKYFNDFENRIDREYQEVIDENKEKGFIGLSDIAYIQEVVESLKSNILLFELLIEDGILDCKNDFKLRLFAFYSLEFPAYTWAYCIYEHDKLGFFKGVKYDVSDFYDNGLNNRIISCKYFGELPENLDWETKGEDYENAKTLNFIGFSALFSGYQIDELKLLLSLKDLAELKKLSTPY